MRKSVLLSAAGLMALATALALSTVAQAQNEVVTVTGSLESDVPRRLAATGHQVDTISAAAIKNGGYVDVSKTLAAEAPGLFMAPEMGGPFDYVDVSFQGSRKTEILWLVDGVRLNNRLYATTMPLDSIPAAMVERIEVMQGGQALFYGTQALAGAVNIITKGFSNTRDGQISIGGDSFYGAHIDANYRDAFGRSQIVIFGSADVSPGQHPFPATDIQPSASIRKRSYNAFTAGGKYQLQIADDLSFSASYEKNLGHVNYPATQEINKKYNRRDEDIATGRIDYKPSDTFQVYAKGYYHSWKSEYYELNNDPLAPGGVRLDYNNTPWGFDDMGANVLAKIELMPGVSAVTGYDYQTYKGSDAVLVIAPQSESVQAVFGQFALDDLIPGAHLAFGARYNIPEFAQDAFVWNASGQFNLTDSLYVKGAVGTSFRLATAEELFANDPGYERGDPNIKPESGFGATGSFGGQFSFGPATIDWRLTGFYREVKNQIDYAFFDAIAGQDVFGNIPGKVISRGFEAYGTTPIDENVSAFADFTFASSTASGTPGQIRRIPETVFKLGLDFHPGDLPLGANLNVQHVGELADTLGGTPPIGRVSYGNYTVVNLSGRYFVDEARQHRIGLTLNNIFDEEYSSHLFRGTDDISGAPFVGHARGMGRTLYLNYTFSVQ